MPHKAAGLSRRQKIIESARFKAVFERRISVHGQFFSVHVAGNSAGLPRLGIAVSRRVSKKAVERNRIKRQVRESFRLNREKLLGMDYVVVGKQRGENQDNVILRRELDGLWDKSREKYSNR